MNNFSSENLKLRDDINSMELKIDEKIYTLSNKTCSNTYIYITHI